MSGEVGSDRAAVAREGVEMGYVWRIPGCRCVVAAQIDGPAYRASVAKFKRDRSMVGFELDHLPVAEIQALPWGWPCEHMKAGAPSTDDGSAVVSEVKP